MILKYCRKSETPIFKKNETEEIKVNAVITMARINTSLEIVILSETTIVSMFKETNNKKNRGYTRTGRNTENIAAQ